MSLRNIWFRHWACEVVFILARVEGCCRLFDHFRLADCKRCVHVIGLVRA